MRGLGLYGKLFVWLVLVIYDRKFSAGTVFFSHTNQPAVLLHEPATIRTSQPNRLVLLQFVSQLMHACCASSTNSEEPEIDRWTEQIVQEMVGACALRRGLRMTASEEWEKPGD